MSHSAAATSPECRCKTDIYTAVARSYHVDSTTTLLATGLLSNSIQTACVNVFCQSAYYQHCPAYISNIHGSVCRHFCSPSGSPVIHVPEIRRTGTKNSYETWVACVLSFVTCSMERIASQYPQHCQFNTIQTTVKDTVNIAFDFTA